MDRKDIQIGMEVVVCNTGGYPYGQFWDGTRGIVMKVYWDKVTIRVDGSSCSDGARRALRSIPNRRVAFVWSHVEPTIRQMIMDEVANGPM